MRTWLGTLCVLVLASLLWATWRATLVRSVFDNADLLRDPWFVATLIDAYAGFLLFWSWAAWREQRPLPAVLWLAALLALGNLAAAAYVLLRLWRTRGGSVGDVLGRDPAATGAAA